MNMFKKKDGFTLVELIVVIAILAILAGVAVPAYTGYLQKAEDTAVVSELSAVLTAAQASKAATGGEVSSITISSDGTITIDSTTVDDGSDFDTFYGHHVFNGDLDGTSYENGVNWDPTNGWTAATATP